MRLAVVNLKGGAGKTTSAVFLAWLLSADGPTLAIDADPQTSLTRWSVQAVQAGEAWTLPVVGLAVPDIHKRVGALAEGRRHVVIDTPPLRPDITRSAVLAADTVLVTLAPNLIELDRLAPTLELINEVWNVHEPAIRALLLRGRAGTRSRPAARALLAEFQVPLLEAEVPLLEAYAQAFGTVPRAGGHYSTVLEELLAGAAA